MSNARTETIATQRANDHKDLYVDAAKRLRRIEQLETLDCILKKFLETKPKEKRQDWLKHLFKGLGISYAIAAEKLNKSRQYIHQLEKLEQQQSPTLKTMGEIAHAFDCEFIYGFVPKNHATYSELILERAAHLASYPPIRKTLPPKRRTEILASRVQKLMADPTGRGQIWGQKKALERRRFNWIWANTHVQLRPRK